jgi:hypothetical protein
MSHVTEKTDNNVFFLLEELEPNKPTSEDDIKTLLDELNASNELDTNDDMNQFSYLDSEFCKNDRLFYNQAYTVKDLLKICQYYGIDKHMKTSKYKKSDLIDAILYYENIPNNFETVCNRYKMWEYMEELVNDPRMKKYVIWN